MRIGLVYFYNNNEDRIKKIAQGVYKGLESQGHNVELINGNKEHNKKLTVYNYIVIGAESIFSFSGKIPENVNKFIGSAGVLSRKNAYVFVSTNILGARKALLRLMRIMEHAGMMVIANEVFNNPDEAENVSKKIHFE